MEISTPVIGNANVTKRYALHITVKALTRQALVDCFQGVEIDGMKVFDLKSNFRPFLSLKCFGCGHSVTYNTVDDIPLEDVPCPNCPATWLFGIQVRPGESKV